MADKELAIKVNKLSKEFKLPHQKISSIKSIFTNFRAFKNRTFERQVALKDISFKVEKGEFFGIVGRNGSGKSTLLKILAGIYQPTKGEVTTNGKIVPFIELGVGFNPELTGRENVYLNGAMLGFSDKQVDVKYDSIVDFAELERFMDQKLKNYSSGMQVRLAFSVATILAESDILLLDEVLAVGDADFQRKCFDYFRKLKKQKKTVIFISHDMDAVRHYCNRAILIDDGLVKYKGSAQEVAKEYTRLFINSSDEGNAEDKDSSSKRFGDRAYMIDSVKLDKHKYIRNSDKFINLKVKVTSKSNTSSDVIVGFLIKNSSGNPVFGTNTHIEGQLISLKSGKSLVVDWEIPNILGDGKYTLDVAATSVDGADTHDWWEECERLTVYKEVSTPYIVSPSVPTKVDYL